MDRYWITKEQKGLNKIAIPSQDEIKKYRKGADQKPKESPLMSKAEICAEIIRLRNPRFTNKDVVEQAPALAKLSMKSLLALLRETDRFQKGI
jgi:hypothetical protein